MRRDREALMLERFISAINGLNQPYIAIAVVVLGCVFDVVCQRFQISNDAATGIIGAGIGLLTGQALNRGNHLEISAPGPTPSVIVNPTPAVAPPKE
jgi:hypothetical protein